MKKPSLPDVPFRSDSLFSFGFFRPALVAVVFFLVGSRTAFVSAASPPNVVFIISDDQAWYDFGFSGHDAIHTPNLDKLAAEGALFTRSYVPTSLCRPSLATFITGLYPHQHKIVGNDPPLGIDRREMLQFIQATPTLPRLLQDKKYLSLQTGKWWEGNFSEGHFTQGMTHGDPSRGGRHGDLGLKIGREGLQPIDDFLKQTADKPFFLWYAPMMPHLPHTPPARLRKKYVQPGRPRAIADYYAMCEWFDETVGQVRDLLAKHGKQDNTLIVFTVDNGWITHTGEGKANRGGAAPRSKISPYESGIRVPIILHWPGRIKPQTHDFLAGSIDIAPTILAACDVEIPKTLPGVNLLESCRTGKPPARDALFGEIFSHDLPSFEKPADKLTHRWCIRDHWKLIVDRSGKELELYDLQSDPREKINLASKQPTIVAELQKRLEDWWPEHP